MKKSKNIQNKNLSYKSLIKKIINSRLFIAIVFTIFGGLCGTILVNNSSSNAIENIINYNDDETFDDLFNHKDIFSEMHLMRKRFDDMFERQEKIFNQRFSDFLSEKQNDSIFVNESVSVTSKREDNKLSYRLDFSGYDKDDIIVNIKENILTLSANKKQQNSQKNDNKILRSKSIANFYYSFSLPNDIDISNPIINRNKTYIEIIFPKKQNYKK